jgi:hypothetical protein
MIGLIKNYNHQFNQRTSGGHCKILSGMFGHVGGPEMHVLMFCVITISSSSLSTNLFIQKQHVQRSIHSSTKQITATLIFVSIHFPRSTGRRSALGSQERRGVQQHTKLFFPSTNRSTGCFGICHICMVLPIFSVKI